MSKSLAYEVATRGITVNCLAPGFIATAMTEKLTDEQKTGILTQSACWAHGHSYVKLELLLYTLQVTKQHTLRAQLCM